MKDTPLILILKCKLALKYAQQMEDYVERLLEVQTTVVELMTDLRLKATDHEKRAFIYMDELASKASKRGGLGNGRKPKVLHGRVRKARKAVRKDQLPSEEEVNVQDN